MFQKMLKVILSIIGAVIGYGAYQLTAFIAAGRGYDFDVRFSFIERLFIAVVFVIIFGLIFLKLTPLLTRQGQKAAVNIESDLKNRSANDIMMTSGGLIVGLIIAYLLSGLYEGISIPILQIVMNIITYVILGSLGVLVANTRGKDIRETMLAVRRSQTSGKSGKHKPESVPKILDTSVIIDGRIFDIMKTGFLEGPIIIAEFVLVELQHVADSSDSLKRNRGRRGLDILNRIQTEYGVEIYNTAEDKSLEEIPEVDVKLLKLAQNIGGKVVTNDFNLNKVAAIKGVPVLNINELANTLKPVVLPGEEMILSLVKEGKERGQAVAYLDDGTMIVVEDGRRFIGQTIKVTVTSVLQTTAGRMIFAKPSGDR